MREPRGGHPLVMSPRPNLIDDVLRHRAREAVLWAMPAVAIYRFRAGAFESLGARDNDILAYSRPATPSLETLTANSSTPYIAAYTDLRRGPVVMEVPAADDDGTLYGQVVDAWQLTIADIGPSGLDQGRGGRYLFTPPGYRGPVLPGFLHVAAPSYRVSFALRSVRLPGKTDADAHAYAHRCRLYYLSEAENPPEQRFLDPVDATYSTLPIYDETFMQDIHAIISVEPIAPRDTLMMGYLSSLGVRRDEPYTPTSQQLEAARAGVADAYHYMSSCWEQPAERYRFWPDRHYYRHQWVDNNDTFRYVYDDLLDVDGRAAAFLTCTYMPRRIDAHPANWYLVAFFTDQGEPFQPGLSYGLNVPPDVPVDQFWSFTVYDHDTYAFIYSDLGRTTLSSYDLPTMTRRSDGSVDLYVGPQPPPGLESNWIPTEGKRPFPFIRFYGAQQSLHDRTWRLPDFQRTP